LPHPSLVYGVPDPVKPNAVTSVYGAMRFALEAFPLYILPAKLGTVFLAILQGTLIIYWSLGLSTVV
jgi:hypothetical protein